MKITHNVVISFHPIFITLDQPFEDILDFRFWIADFGYVVSLCSIIHHNCFTTNRAKNTKKYENSSLLALRGGYKD
jgi:hypothetical protein